MSREGWFAPSYGVPSHVKDQIHQWVQSVSWPEGTKLKHPDKYHITSFYSPEGYQDPSHHEWLQQDGGKSFPAITHSLDSFDSPNPNSGLKPIVMKFHAPELSAHAEGLMSAAESRGLQPTRFPGGHKPHITVAEAPELPNATPPQIRFQTEPLHELHSYYDSLKRQANILDPIHPELDPLVWDNAADPEPTLKPVHHKWLVRSITKVLKDAGYEGMEKWLSLVFTGSLTTYQYSADSDVDISLFVDTKSFPDWSRAEMIGLMVSKMDGTTMPGTPHIVQCFVVSRKLSKEDLYQPGMRSGYDLDTSSWIVPPERERVHDVQAEMSAQYMHALQQADKMEKLLTYEPDKAIMFWHQIHNRRRRDMLKGKGDYADSNITYKMLNNRGLFPKISEISGEYLAKVGKSDFAVLMGNLTDEEATAFGEYLAEHNEADRDSGELDDVPDEQVERWYENWETDGRPGMRTAAIDVAAEALQGAQANGGITIRPDGTQPTAGYAFSPFKGLETIIPLANLREEDVDRFMRENQQALANPQNYLGIWVSDGNAYLDVTQVQPEFDIAYKTAWDADQEALWDIVQGKEVPVRAGGATPLEIESNFLQGANRLAVKLPQNQVAKFVYNPIQHHLVVGGMAKEEGEVESHADLLRQSGLPPGNNIYGQFDPSGRAVTFGRAKIEGFGQLAMSPYEADYRTKQALEQTVPGTRLDTFIPTHEKWNLTKPPQVTYMREPPVIGDQTEPESDVWTFS